MKSYTKAELDYIWLGLSQAQRNDPAIHDWFVNAVKRARQ